MIRKLLLLLALIAPLNGAIPVDGEIVLKGDLSFRDILTQAEEQLGIDVELPMPADDRTSSPYNQIITLAQLVDAVVLRYAQDDVPLDWNYEARTLTFTRKDRPSSARSQPALRPRVSSSPETNERVPVVTEPPPAPEVVPVRPAWLDQTLKARRTPQPPAPKPAPLPVITPRGLQGQGAPVSTPPVRMEPPRLSSLDDLNTDVPPEAFAVTIPRPTTVIRAIPSPQPAQQRTTSPSTSQPSFPSASTIPPRSGTPAVQARDIFDELERDPLFTSTLSGLETPPLAEPPRSRPVPVVPAPTYPRYPQPDRGRTFAITPYPKEESAFFNDAPSIVPGKPKESDLEWKTRMKGAMQAGNRTVLEAERLVLQRRLNWLRERLR